jgi:hypothetical protein
MANSFFFVRRCQNLRIFSCVNEQKNVFNAFVRKLGSFWHSWGFKTLVSLAF